jgi:hypothetical protein
MVDGGVVMKIEGEKTCSGVDIKNTEKFTKRAIVIGLVLSLLYGYCCVGGPLALNFLSLNPCEGV